MENYIHWECIQAAYRDNKIEILINQNFADFDDVPVEVAKLVHAASNSTVPWDDLAVDKRSKKESRAKRFLNASAAKHMTVDRLAEIDPDGDLRNWFKDIKELFEED